MPGLNVVNRENSSSFFEIKEGQSLMEFLRECGYDELIAICGGNCSCATCHVYFHDIDLSILPEMLEDEEVLLDSLEHVSPESRLSCQIKMSYALEGATIIIPPEE